MATIHRRGFSSVLRLRALSPTERADALPEQHGLLLTHVAYGRAVRRPRAGVDDEVDLLTPGVADGRHVAEERDLMRVRDRVRDRVRVRVRVSQGQGQGSGLGPGSGLADLRLWVDVGLVPEIVLRIGGVA